LPIPSHPSDRNWPISPFKDEVCPGEALPSAASSMSELMLDRYRTRRCSVRALSAFLDA
jgi:hypothetical protein